MNADPVKDWEYYVRTQEDALEEAEAMKAEAERVKTLSWDKICRYCVNEGIEVKCLDCERTHYGTCNDQFVPKECGNCDILGALMDGASNKPIADDYCPERQRFMVADGYCSGWQPKEADNED